MQHTSTVLTQTGINSGSLSTASNSVFIGTLKTVVALIEPASGTITSSVIVFQCSDNNTDWYTTPANSGAMVAGANTAITLDGIAADYVRVIVGTASASPSTFNLVIQAK